jgi:hypothetical protein
VISPFSILYQVKRDIPAGSAAALALTLSAFRCRRISSQIWLAQIVVPSNFKEMQASSPSRQLPSVFPDWHQHHKH